jgi:hypothetical protein|nr:MAG TPA: hypothetical protein [Caudoviricetes sp.]
MKEELNHQLCTVNGITLPNPLSIVLSSLALCHANGMSDIEIANFICEELFCIMSNNDLVISTTDRGNLLTFISKS